MYILLLIEKLLKLNVDFPNIIHPSVQKAENCKLGKGVIIQHNSIISVEAKIGDFVQVPFGKSKITGIVWNEFEKSGNKKFKIKRIIKKLNVPQLKKKTLEFP